MISISSYKGHSVFALLLALMFFHNPLLIALTFIGANIPDFDHKFKKDHVYKLIILGLIVFISLYILKLPYFVGLIIVFLGITLGFTILDNSYLIIAVLIALLSFLFLNKKLLLVFLPVFFLSLFFIKNINFTYIEIVLALFLGVFSHIVLDSFTPAGIKIFAPLSSKKVYKRFGLISIFILVIFAILYHLPILFKLFEQYISMF